MPIGDLKPFLRGDLKCQRVGATADGYTGPVADIWYDKEWLRIETDPHEGSVMLNIEALPKLIAALNRIKRALP